MSKKGRTDRKAAAGPPLEADKSQLSLDPAMKTLAERESVVVTDEPTGSSREDDAEKRKKAAALRQDAAELRQDAAKLRQQAAELRQGTAGQREITADLREEIADIRQDTADQREDIADLREEAADLRQDTADQRQDTASLQQDTADLRQVTADLRQEAADKREESAISKAKLSASTQTRLKEANKRLIIATINAQTLAETAELATEQMTYMADHDFLTGLPNRALLTDRLAQSIALAKRHSKKVALMYLDLDHFKHINDSLGHTVGDMLLQSVAKRLQTCVRHSDTISRQGGDEFVVLLNQIEDVHDAVLTAEKIIEAMNQPHFVSGNKLHVTFSIGISIYPDNGKDIGIIVRNADTAMYQAKEKGRNNYQVFIKKMEVRAVARQSVEHELHRALEQHKFVLHYQPKVNLNTGAITGAEVLIRIRESDNKLVYPAHFIGIAEECGLILPIGRWALREACRQTQAWLKAGLGIGQIAVNVSSREFHSQEFLAGVISVLNDTGLDPCHLELEMTESGLMRDTEPSMVILYAFRKLGVQIAIDNFGTGYSSLSYLMRFPLDTLKIDQSFVQNLDDVTDNSGNAIINAVIAMGESLKHRVVAQGIETKQQLAFLQSHHCTEGQGYYFSRPVAADVFASLLAKDLNGGLT